VKGNHGRPGCLACKALSDSTSGKVQGSRGERAREKGFPQVRRKKVLAGKNGFDFGRSHAAGSVEIEKGGEKRLVRRRGQNRKKKERPKRSQNVLSRNLKKTSKSARK